MAANAKYGFISAPDIRCSSREAGPLVTGNLIPALRLSRPQSGAQGANPPGKNLRYEFI